MDISLFLHRFNLSAWHESHELEWKISTRESKEIVCTLAAFANGGGGVVVCGVDDRGVVVGQDVGDSTVREMTQTVLASTQERLYPTIERLTLEEKSVLVLSVTPSPLRPHVAYGRPYARVGSSSVVMDQAEYHRLLGMKSNGAGADRDVCPEASVNSLDLEKLRRFIERANDRRNLTMSVYAEPLEVLESLELARGGELLKGAVLLFGREPERYIPAAEIRAAHFRSDDRSFFLAQRVIGGDLFQQFDEALRFVKDRLPIRIDTSKVGDRTVEIVPSVAIQELIANALVHRDYRDGAGTYLTIIGEDLLEIANPGSLPAPRVTPETILLPHPSLPANRRIARAFFLAGLIEQWGEGARRADRVIREAGLPSPVWRSERGTVSVEVSLSKSTHENSW